MAILARVTEKVDNESRAYKNFEILLLSLGFEAKVSKIHADKKMWSHTKISYIHIFTELNYYRVRLWSRDNSNYDAVKKQYSNEQNIIDVLKDG